MVEEGIDASLEPGVGLAGSVSDHSASFLGGETEA